MSSILVKFESLKQLDQGGTILTLKPFFYVFSSLQVLVLELVL